MKHKQIRVAVLVLAAVALLAGSFLAGRALARSRVVRAQEEAIPAAPADPAASAFACTNISNVAAFDNRIHVKCSTPNTVGTNTVYFYAYPTTGSSGYTANRMLAVGQTAFALNKAAWIFYQASTSYNPPSCNSGDCRLLVGVSMVE